VAAALTGVAPAQAAERAKQKIVMVKARELYAVQQLNVATLSPNALTNAAAWRTRPSPDLKRFTASADECEDDRDRCRSPFAG
jgi:hypothetical protein